MQTARTTIELDKELLKKVKQRAIDEERSLKQFIDEAVRKQLEEKVVKKRESKAKKIYPFKAYDMGEMKGTLRREEIYDWL